MQAVPSLFLIIYLSIFVSVRVEHIWIAVTRLSTLEEEDLFEDPVRKHMIGRQRCQVRGEVRVD